MSHNTKEGSVSLHKMQQNRLETVTDFIDCFKHSSFYLFVYVRCQKLDIWSLILRTLQLSSYTSQTSQETHQIQASTLTFYFKTYV